MPVYNLVNTTGNVLNVNATSAVGRTDGVNMFATLADLSPSPVTFSTYFSTPPKFKASALNGRGGADYGVNIGRPAKLEAIHASGTSTGFTFIGVLECSASTKYASYIGRRNSVFTSARYSFWDLGGFTAYQGLTTGDGADAISKAGKEPRIFVVRFIADAPGSSTGTLMYGTDGMLLKVLTGVTLKPEDPSGSAMWILFGDGLNSGNYLPPKDCYWGHYLIWDNPLSDANLLAELVALRSFYGIDYTTNASWAVGDKANLVCFGNSIATGDYAERVSGYHAGFIAQLQRKLTGVGSSSLISHGGYTWDSIFVGFVAAIVSAMRPNVMNILVAFEHSNTLGSAAGSDTACLLDMNDVFDAIRAAVPAGYHYKIVTSTAISRGGAQYADNAGYRSNRAALNTTLRTVTGSAKKYDLLADFATVASGIMDGDYWFDQVGLIGPDKTHPITLGHDHMYTAYANVIQPVINAFVPDSVAPVVASATVDAAGTTLTLTFTEASNPPVLPESGVTGFTMSGGHTLSAGTRTAPTTVTFPISPVVYIGETVTYGYSGGNLTDSANIPNPLATIVGGAVTNNSTQVVQATGFTLTGPASGAVGVASGDFMVTPTGGVYTGTITPNDGGQGGTFTPASLSWTGNAVPKTFKYTPATVGAKSIAATGSPSLSAPSAVSYNALDGTSPVLASAVVNATGNLLTVTFSEVDSLPMLPATGVTGFSMSGGHSLSGGTRISGGVMTFAINPVVYSTETLTVSYSGGSVTDNAANPLGNIVAGSITNNSTQVMPTVATPTFDPPGGTYTSEQDVMISCVTDGATIHYTTNGTTPTESSPVLSGPITVESTKTVKAIAVKDGYTDSLVGSATYNINIPQVIATPTFSPVAGTYLGSRNVTINCATEDVDMFYTLDGTEPDDSSTPYTGQIPVTDTTTIKVVAMKVGSITSAVATGEFIIAPAGGGGAVIRQVTILGDYPQLVTLAPWVVTAGDVADSVCIPLKNTDGRNVMLTGDEECLFNMREVGSTDSVIDDAPATLSQFADGGWAATFDFDETTPIPAGGNYEITMQVGGRTYPRGGRQQVRVQGEI